MACHCVLLESHHSFSMSVVTPQHTFDLEVVTVYSIKQLGDLDVAINSIVMMYPWIMELLIC